MSEGILKQVINDIERVSDELNLVDGLLHAQLINQGYTCMIGELTRRTPGDSYLSLRRRSLIIIILGIMWLLSWEKN